MTTFRRTTGFRGRPRTSRVCRAGLAVLAALVLAAACAPSADPSGYSVILVTLDTTRADRLGTYGGPVPTPNFDRIAAEGVLFEEAISQVPITLPSHASILTGRYPASHGVRHNGLYRLPESETTLAERLADAGFATAGFVAAYVLNPGYGVDQGFETYEGVAQGKGGPEGQSRASEATADEINAKVFSWLDARPEGRFLLWVHYYDPHAPYSPPETPGRTLHGEGYDREVSYMDHAFGDLVRRLEKDGVLDRSVLVVVGDHGESLGQHREQTHGIFLYEPAVRVPMFVRAPGLVPAGKRVGGTVETVDVAPTVLDLLGLEPLAEAQGRSLVPTFGGRNDGPGVAFAETLMPRLEFGWSELRMARDGRYKYVEAPTPELYDLRADPGETDNLAGSDPGIAADMAAALRAWVERTVGEASEESAERGLSPEEEARLRSLGYLGGDYFKTGDGSGTLPDPKDRIDEGIAVWAARDRIRDGEVEAGVADLDAVLEANPANQLALTTRLAALVRLGRIALAEEDALALLALASEDPDASGELMDRARLTLASIYWIQGREDEAFEQHRLAKERAPESRSRPGGFSNLLLGAAGGVEDAERIVDLVLAKRPDDGMALSARFELEMHRGDHAAALRTAGRLANARVGDGASFLRAAKLLKDAGRPAEAARCFEAVIRVSPPNADLYGYLGTSRLAAGDLDGAETALRKAIELRPEDPRGPYYLGNVSLARGREVEARELYGRSLELNPQFVPPLVQLARYLEAEGRRAEALVVLEDALRRKPDDREATELRNRLRGVG